MKNNLGKNKRMCWGVYTDNDTELPLFFGTVRQIVEHFGGTINALNIQTCEILKGGKHRVMVNREYYRMYPLWYENRSGDILYYVDERGVAV